MCEKLKRDVKQEMPDDWKHHRQCGRETCQDCDDEWYDECDDLVEK